MIFKKLEKKINIQKNKNKKIERVLVDLQTNYKIELIWDALRDFCLLSEYASIPF